MFESAAQNSKESGKYINAGTFTRKIQLTFREFMRTALGTVEKGRDPVEFRLYLLRKSFEASKQELSAKTGPFDRFSCPTVLTITEGIQERNP